MEERRAGCIGFPCRRGDINYDGAVSETPSPRGLARAAGLFYLITIVCGVFAELFVRSRLIFSNDAAATAANILAHESLYRVGLAADLVMLAAYIAVTVLLYILFKPVSARVSLVAAWFSIIGIAVLAVNSLNHAAPLLLLKRAPYLDTFTAPQLESLALFALKLHGRGYAISGAFFGIYCMTIGWLAFKSGFLPRFIGVLMFAGGAGYVINTFVGLVSPATAASLPDFTIAGGIGELALTLWLLIKGDGR